MTFMTLFLEPECKREAHSVAPFPWVASLKHVTASTAHLMIESYYLHCLFVDNKTVFYLSNH